MCYSDLTVWRGNSKKFEFGQPGMFLRWRIRIDKESAHGFDKVLNFDIKIPIGSQIFALQVPILTIALIVALCFFILWFKKTKIGHDMRAVGQDQKVSSNAGLNTNKIRIQSIVISTVLACYGQIIYLQNIGTVNIYAGQDQVAFYAVASLLVGGASVIRASIPNALIGTLL